jgi:salicylate hydroxylase
MKSGSILIVGGGIGGLTTALAMRKFGFDVDIFEAAPAFTQVGAGVTLAPNAMRGFDYLGVGDAIGATSMEPLRQAVRHWQDGRVLMTLERGNRMREEYGAAYYYTHRADLHAVLVDAAERAGVRIHLGAPVQQVSSDADHAELVTADGRRFTGDLLVGADGVKSVVRRLFETAPAIFTGHVAIRAVVPVDDELRPFAETPGNFIGPNRIAVFYPLRGGSLLNLVFFSRETGWNEEGWTIPATRAELEKTFAGWCAPVQTMIAHADADQLFKWAINARAPLNHWSRDGRITLLGDAAHAMTPFLGQGASSAIEDAVVLARALADSATTGEALARYEAARIERATMIQAESNLNADRLQGEDTDLFGMKKLRNEETLGLFAYDCGAVPV